MRKLIIATLFVASIWAYPEKYDFDVNFNEIQISEVPDIQVQEAASDPIDAKCIMAIVLTHDQDEINDCADKGLARVDKYVAENLEPIDLAPVHGGFSYKLIINYHGEIDLKNGQVKGLSSLHRIGDTILDVTLTSGDFILPLEIDKLDIYYHYSAKIMNLGPSGGIEARARNVKFVLNFGYDMEKKEIHLTEFDITSTGKIDFDFTGNKLVDWLFELLTDAVAALLKKTVRNLMENEVRKAIEHLVEEVNKSLQSAPDALIAEIPPYKPLQNPIDYVKPQI